MLPLSLPSVHVGLQTLRANPVRTLLSTLGVVMGAASLVAVLSVGDGAEAFARQQLERLGLQVVAVLAKTADTVDTREIGVRKAAGAKRRDIAVQFLSESVAISLAGTIVGTVVGATSAFGVTALLRWRTQGLLYATLTWQTFLFSMSVAAAVGLILGVYPALKAARLSPVEVMRYQ